MSSSSSKALCAIFAVLVAASGCLEEMRSGIESVLWPKEEQIYQKPIALAFDPLDWENQVVVDEQLLTLDKLICSPRKDDKTPQCGQAYASDETDIAWQSVIAHNMCPSKDGEYARIITITDGLDGSDPPGGRLRSAYYCLSENRFWILDYENIHRPQTYWFGPYEGYPVTEKTGYEPKRGFEHKTTSSSTSTISTTFPRFGHVNWIPDTGQCDLMGASYWRALCYDELAYMLKNESLCGSIYCKARFDGPHICSLVSDESIHWRAYRQRACQAWAEGSHFVCDHILKSEECIRWYAMLAQDISLCRRADRGGQNCAPMFSFWRGDEGICWQERTLSQRKQCESMLYKMRGMDGGGMRECDRVTSLSDRRECMEAVQGLIRTDSELYAIENELLFL